MGWKTLPEEQQKQLELALMNHEKAHPQPTITKTDGTPIGEDQPPVPLDQSEEGDSPRE
jgi:hypothetical protein